MSSSSCHAALPLFRQTNDDKTRDDPEDYLLFSRIQSLHHCLEVDFHDEEDELHLRGFLLVVVLVLVVQIRDQFIQAMRNSDQ